MISIRMFGGSSMVAEQQRSRLIEAILVVTGGIAVALFILKPVGGLAAVFGCLAAAVIMVSSEVFRGKIDRALLCWAALFPLGYFVMFPRERSVVTPERIVLLLAFVGLLFVKRGTLTATPKALRRTGFACLVFIVIAGLSLTKSLEPLNSARTLFDSYVLPLLFGWFVIAWSDVRGRLAEMHTAVCISSVICAAIAAAEMITKEDLLPVGNSVMFYAGGIPRPNGPFASNDVLAMAGGFSLFFLLFLRKTLGSGLSASRRVLHFIGVAAALGMALMPMFRSVAVTLLLVLLIDTIWEKQATGRARRIALVVTCVVLILVAPLLAPQSMIEDRSSEENAYGRFAQFDQNLQVFLDHPLLGVGYLNFHNYVVGEPRYQSHYQGVASLDWPHNNLAEALAETGLLGFVPYLTMHGLLVAAMWRLRRVCSSGDLAWKYFLYLFLTYWITGLTESSGHEFSNLWYTFIAIFIYKYSATQLDTAALPQEQSSDDDLYATMQNTLAASLH